MMIYLLLFYEFFKVGLFSIGGGLATIPFLHALAQRLDWFSVADLTNMIAVSESTPGPLGINMATFAGIKTAGLLGGFSSTLGLIFPSFFIIIFISKFLNRFKENKTIKAIFYGLRPAVSVMIFIFLVAMSRIIISEAIINGTLFISSFLFVCYLILILRFKYHPIFFILLAAVMGILMG